MSDRSLVGPINMQAREEEGDRGFQEATVESQYPGIMGADRCVTGKSRAGAQGLPC